jgi:hypothetical protein
VVFDGTALDANQLCCCTVLLANPGRAELSGHTVQAEPSTRRVAALHQSVIALLDQHRRMHDIYSLLHIFHTVCELRGG